MLPFKRVLEDSHPMANTTFMRTRTLIAKPEAPASGYWIQELIEVGSNGAVISDDSPSKAAKKSGY